MKPNTENHSHNSNHSDHPRPSMSGQRRKSKPKRPVSAAKGNGPCMRNSVARENCLTQKKKRDATGRRRSTRRRNDCRRSTGKRSGERWLSGMCRLTTISAFMAMPAAQASITSGPSLRHTATIRLHLCLLPVRICRRGRTRPFNSCNRRT